MIYRSKKQIAHAPSFANLSVKNAEFNLQMQQNSD